MPHPTNKHSWNNNGIIEYLWDFKIKCLIPLFICQNGLCVEADRRRNRINKRKKFWGLRLEKFNLETLVGFDSRKLSLFNPSNSKMNHYCQIYASDIDMYIMMARGRKYEGSLYFYLLPKIRRGNFQTWFIHPSFNQICKVSCMNCIHLFSLFLLFFFCIPNIEYIGSDKPVYCLWVRWRSREFLFLI